MANTKVSWEFEFPLSEEDMQEVIGIEDEGKVQKEIDSAFIHYMRNKMPFDNGIMAANTSAKGHPGLVVVNVLYAHYMNEGILYVNPKYNSPGFPVKGPNGGVVGFKGFRGKRVPTERPLHYQGGLDRGAHFVERTIAVDRDKIIEAAIRSIKK